jgi:hypothetical protein
MLIRKLIFEVNGEVLKDMLVGVSSPVHMAQSYKELRVIQPGNVAKLNCLIATITNENGAFE